MAYDETVAERIREVFKGRKEIVEKKMFGGIAFMYAGNMCCGVVDDMLMARIGPEAYPEALQRPNVREMDFTGKSLKGFVYVEPAGFAEHAQLIGWLELCEVYTASLPAK